MRQRVLVAQLVVMAQLVVAPHVVAVSVPSEVQTYGPLVIIGGEEDSHGKILREFVRLSGGDKARIVVIPVASKYVATEGAEYVKDFLRFGAESVEAFDVATKKDANDKHLIDALSHATGVFFTGGDQGRLVHRLRDTAMQHTIQQRHSDGMILAGTSAGAAMMSHHMIVRGLSDATPAEDDVRVVDGMSFVRGVIIDMHFSKRRRIGRLLSALAKHQGQIGIGIDEKTALVVEKETFRVIGQGAVTIVDARSARFETRDSNKAAPLAVFGAKMSVVPADFSFHFEDGAPVPQDDSSAEARGQHSAE
jgi:cyanophycinase